MTWSFVPWEQVSTLREGVHTGRGGRYSWFRVEHPAGSLDVKSSYTNYALLLSYIRARMAEVASAKRAAAAKPPSPAEPDRDGHFAKNRPDIGAIPSASVPFTQGLELENYSAPMRFVPKTFASPAPAGAIVGSIAATPLAAFVLIIPVPPPYRPGMEFLALLVFLTSLALPRYFYSVALRKRPYAVFEVDDEGFFWGDGNDELRARWGQVTLVSRAGDVLSVKTSLGWIHLTPGNFDRPYTLRMYIRSHLPASVQVPPGTFGDVTDPVSQ